MIEDRAWRLASAIGGSGATIEALPDHPGSWPAAVKTLAFSTGVIRSTRPPMASHPAPVGAPPLSFKLGIGERVKEGRRFTDMTEERLAERLNGCGAFGQPDIWQSRDCRPDRAPDVWVK